MGKEISHFEVNRFLKTYQTIILFHIRCITKIKIILTTSYQISIKMFPKSLIPEHFMSHCWCVLHSLGIIVWRHLWQASYSAIALFTSVLTSWQTKSQIPTKVLTFSGISSSTTLNHSRKRSQIVSIVKN